MHAFLFYLPFLLFFVLVAVYGERKIAAFIQSRFGPMDVGPKGIFQTLADLLKMMQKEDLVPKAADKPIFLIRTYPCVYCYFCWFFDAAVKCQHSWSGRRIRSFAAHGSGLIGCIGYFNGRLGFQ